MYRYLAITSLILASLAMTCPAGAQPRSCTLVQKEQCEPGSPCRSIASTVGLILDAQTGSYQRCNGKGCDTYKAVVSKSGIWTLMENPGHGFFAKISPNQEVVEVVSMNSVVLVGYGTCR